MPAASLMTRDEALTWICRAMDDCGPTLDQNQYNRWAAAVRQSGGGTPLTHESLRKHFGTFAALRHEAGGRSRMVAHSQEQMRDYIQRLGADPHSTRSSAIEQAIYRQYGALPAACRALGLPARQRWSTPSRKQCRYNDDHLLRVLRQAAADGALSTARYAQWARSHADAPTVAIFFRRFGSWLQALSKAGVDVSPRQLTGALKGPADSRRRWRESEIVQAVHASIKWHGVQPTVEQYAAWRNSHSPGAPSITTIRNRLGSWSEALRLAQNWGAETSHQETAIM